METYSKVEATDYLYSENVANGMVTVREIGSRLVLVELAGEFRGSEWVACCAEVLALALPRGVVGFLIDKRDATVDLDMKQMSAQAAMFREASRARATVAVASSNVMDAILLSMAAVAFELLGCALRAEMFERPEPALAWFRKATADS